MAFGLATEDDDAESLKVRNGEAQKNAVDVGKVKADLLKEMNKQKVEPETLCKVYNVKTIDELSVSAMQNAIKNMDKINQKAEEMK
jgi:cell division FtsZ-interacting protein ZapD